MTAETHVPTAREVRRLSRVISAATWAIAAVVVTVSVTTTTAFVSAHGQPGKVAPLVGLAVDAGFVVSLTADSTLSRYGIALTSAWPRVMRWACGVISLLLNTGEAVTRRDWSAVAVHAVSPLMLLLIGESGPAYRRALAGALRTAESAPESAPETHPAPMPEALPMVAYAEQVDESAPSAEQANPDRTPAALPADLIRKARKVDERAVRESGRPASLRLLRAELHVGQDRARAVREALAAA